MTRGVLLDVAAVKGAEMLEAGYEVAAADLEEAMKRQGVTIGAGDAVLIHTGGGRLWMKDNVKAGRGPEMWRRMVAHFLAERTAFLSHYHARSNVRGGNGDVTPTSPGQEAHVRSCSGRMAP